MQSYANQNQTDIQKSLPVTANVLVVQIKKRLQGPKRKENKIHESNNFKTSPSFTAKLVIPIMYNPAYTF